MTLDLNDDDKSVSVQVINGLAPSCTKPLLKPVLTKFYVDIWGHNELTYCGVVMP